MKSIYALGALVVSIAPATAMAMAMAVAADPATPFVVPAGGSQNGMSVIESATATATATLTASDFANATSPYARAGWQAQLSTFAHNVSGTVTIVDADTFRVDNFFYDGGGINVHFILAASNNNTLFRTARLVTEPNLLGTAHNGDSITIDLPVGTTFDGYGAISLWCIPASANFGSGSFASPVPESNGAAMLALGLLSFAMLRRRRTQS
jgi:Electron transfer DM13